jgi:predicted amidohydrolase YtcJ
LLAGPTATHAAPPDATVLVNGHIFTGDPSLPWAEALAIERDIVSAVGSNAAIAELTPDHARVIDLQGKTVIPGMNDAHVHVAVPLGAYLNQPDFVPGPGPTTSEVLGMLAGGAAALPPGTWLFAFVGNTVSDDPDMERFALDAVTPDHPVALFAWSGHGTWLDSDAMEALGVAEDEPDPFGGFWVRYADSPIVTGEAHEYAEFRVRRALLSQLPDAALVGLYRAYAAEAVRFGVTTLQDMAVGLPHGRALSILAAADLPLRVRSMCFPLTPDEACAVGSDSGHARVTASGVKWISDGTPIERLAYLTGEYADRPGSSGWSDLGDALEPILEAALDHDARTHQLLFHAVGDAAILDLLGALEAVPGPARWRHRRTRIEHGDLLFPDAFQRVKDLGVVVVQNPTHFTLAGLFAARFDPPTFAQLEPMASLLAQGIPLALGSDSIGRPGNPFVDLLFAVVHPTHPSEALTLEQALAAYTRGSAYAELAEHKKGVLAPGRLADLAVLSQDIFALPPFAWPATTSLLTVVGGEVVWDAGLL